MLLFDQQGKKGRYLHVTGLDWDEAQAFEAGKRLSKVDWNQRTRWDLQWANNTLFFLGDENNDERINVYRMDMDTGAIQALTDTAYVYGYSISQDKKQVAWISRTGSSPYASCLNIMDLDGTQNTEIVCDTPEAKFTWDAPSWSPDGTKIVTRVNVHGQEIGVIWHSSHSLSNPYWSPTPPKIEPTSMLRTCG